MNHAVSIPPRWAHQQAAFEFVEKLWKRGRRGAMLAIIPGGGKSRVAIELAEEVLHACIILILCPLCVVEVWRRQFLEYARTPYHFLALDDRVDRVSEKTRLARDTLAWATAHRQRLVICINYDGARTEPFAHWALANAWDLVICDEVHRLKAAAGRTSRFVGQLGLRAHYRLGLTGTPMAHQPIDIWGQFRFLDPGILDPTFGSFKLRHAVMGGYFNKEIKDWRDLAELNRKFYSIAFRVTEEVLDLPPELDVPLYARPGSEGLRIYDEMERNLVARVADGEVTAANAMVSLLRLQQITGGTLRDDAGREHLVDTAKEDMLAELLSDLDPAEAIVVFARFKSDLAAIRRAARRAGREAAELSGTTNELVLWQRGGASSPTVLAVQIQAGGVGVDLTRARYAVYFSMGFSLTDYIQSRARVRRPPQTRPVTYYFLLIENSIDEIVLRAVLARRDLIADVLGEFQCQPQASTI